MVRTRPTLTWTPTGEPAPRTTSLAEVSDALARGGVVVLSGAGLSTESGIPDYRGAEGTLRRHTPMTYQEFVSSEAGRQRYWARSHVGWRTIARAQPNAGHHAVAELLARGHVSGVITQNVDGLHRVICLGCRRTSGRAELDLRLRAANPTADAVATRINPDGDVELAEDVVRGFHLVDCADCDGGVLKPDVVFFGENVPPERVQQCYRLVDDASALLVLGSSLTVMSGLRFVRYAVQAGKPVFIVNKGETRGDSLAAVRVDLPLGHALTQLTAGLAAG
jgi:NAD-dependent SIR2 family protein deacetylase